MQVAVVACSSQLARKIAAQGKTKIGWVVSRVKVVRKSRGAMRATISVIWRLDAA